MAWRCMGIPLPPPPHPYTHAVLDQPDLTADWAATSVYIHLPWPMLHSMLNVSPHGVPQFHYTHCHPCRQAPAGPPTVSSSEPRPLHTHTLSMAAVEGIGRVYWQLPGSCDARSTDGPAAHWLPIKLTNTDKASIKGEDVLAVRTEVRPHRVTEWGVCACVHACVWMLHSCVCFCAHVHL